MTLQRSKLAGWSVGNKLTSDEIEAVDQNIENALDKRSGQTDTLASNVTVTGTTTFSGEADFNGGENHTGTEAHSGAVTYTGNVQFTGASTSVSGALDTTVGTTALGPTTIATDDLTMGSGSVVFSTPRSYSRYLDPWAALVGETVARVAGFPSNGDAFIPPTTTNTQRTLGSIKFNAVNTGDSTASVSWIFRISDWMPEGATLTSVVLTVSAAAHAGLPAYMPRVRVATITNGPLNSGYQALVDSSASAGAYAASHTLTYVCDQFNVVGKTLPHIFMTVGNEGGTNSVLGFTVGDITLHYTVPAYSPSP